MQLATCFDDKPWCVTVYYAHDNLHNLYWLSLPDTRHSKELLSNPKVAGAIVLPQTYGQPVSGLSFEGQARLISASAELDQSFEAYAERYDSHGRLESLKNGSDNHRLFQIKPTSFVLFDQLNFPDQPRQEWFLAA